MEGILMAIAVIAMLVGTAFYNPLRRKVAGVVGVGGSYMILAGVMLFVMLIGQLFNHEEVSVSIMEIVMVIIFMLLCLGYMVYVMLVRCETVAQRVMLPIIACLIGLGFCMRFILMLACHIPMESGKETASVHFPKRVIDDQGETWQRQGDGTGDLEEYYCGKTGARINLRYTGDYVNYPAGWREG
ncbi:MAG: hypothetical protein IJ002_07325 [Clostridia bacterium]|nr:hypothetical protein [Clostridia bacterium]